MKNQKHLFITLEIIEGEREHLHHCLLTTNEQDIEKAADEYARDYWDDEAEYNDGYWLAHGGELAIRYTKVKELQPDQFELLHDLFHGL